MKVEKFSFILMGVFLFSLITLSALQISSFEQTNKGIFESIFIVTGYVSALSLILLWATCIWDCLGNKKLKSRSWVFWSLVLFNWVASIIYFFKFIYPRIKAKA